MGRRYLVLRWWGMSAARETLAMWRGRKKRSPGLEFSIAGTCCTSVLVGYTMVGMYAALVTLCRVVFAGLLISLDQEDARTRSTAYTGGRGRSAIYIRCPMLPRREFH